MKLLMSILMLALCSCAKPGGSGASNTPDLTGAWKFDQVASATSCPLRDYGQGYEEVLTLGADGFFSDKWGRSSGTTPAVLGNGISSTFLAQNHTLVVPALDSPIPYAFSGANLLITVPTVLGSCQLVFARD